jgi:hypothetical protein
MVLSATVVVTGSDGASTEMSMTPLIRSPYSTG